MRSTLRSNKGFSLVELMVVVSIIGILASIAIPNFQRFTAKAKQSEAKANLSALYSAERAFAAEWQSFFADFRNIGYQPTGNVRYRHGFSAAGIACPGGYQGAGVAAGGAAVQFNTSTAVCGAAGPCTEIVTPVPPGALGSTGGATNTQAAAFSAQARGDIDGDATVDVWNINQNKQLTSGADDIVL